MGWEIREIDGMLAVCQDERIDSRYATRGAAEGRLAQLAAQPATLAADAPQGRPFYAVLAVDDYESNDGRYFEAFTWADLPLTLWSLDTQSMGGHLDAEAVGSIRTIEKMSDGRRVFATGMLSTTDAGKLAEAQIEEGVLRFVSVDPADVEYEEEITKIGTDGWPLDGRLRFTAYQIGGATIVGNPAIRLAVIWLDGMDAPAELSAVLPDPIARVQIPQIVDSEDEPGDVIAVIMASASGATDLPIAERDHAWDGAGAASRVMDACGGADDCDWGEYAKAFFWKDPDAADTKGGYKLGFADIVDGKLTAVPKGVFAAAAAVQGSRGGVDIPQGDVAGVKSRIGTYYSKMAKAFDDDSIKVPWSSNSAAALIPSDDPEVASLVASAVAARAPSCSLTDGCGGPAQPPRDWFADPGLSAKTPLRVTRAGQIMGHVAVWNEPHRGFLNYSWSDRIYAPRSASGYSNFLTKQTPVACCADPDCGHELATIRTGTLVMAGRHADGRLSPAAALAAYEDTGRAVADVVCGEDAHGIWVAGALRPGLSDKDVREFLGSAPSGDWRPNPSLELIAVLMVNAEGFPVRASAAVHDGETSALFAGYGHVEAEDGDVEALVASLGAPPEHEHEAATVSVPREEWEAVQRDLELLRPLAAERLAAEIEASLHAG